MPLLPPRVQLAVRQGACPFQHPPGKLPQAQGFRVPGSGGAAELAQIHLRPVGSVFRHQQQGRPLHAARPEGAGKKPPSRPPRRQDARKPPKPKGRGRRK